MRNETVNAWLSVLVAGMLAMSCQSGTNDQDSGVLDAMDADSGEDAGGNDAGEDGGGSDPGEDPGSDDGGPEPDGADAAGDPGQDVCASLAPDPGGSAQANWEAIQNCLDDRGFAHLGPGEYPIATGLLIPPGAQLLGLDNSMPRLVMQPGNTVNYMIQFAADSTETTKAQVAFLRIDARNNLGLYANASIVTFSGDNNILEGCELTNGSTPPADRSAAAAYVICSQCRGNEILANEMHHNFYGIIFRGESDQYVNRAEGNEIHHNKCDPITFAGYGIAENNDIHDNGWNCENGPIPGGGIYTLDNAAGGVIRNNTICNPCGHGLDMDRAANFLIEGNTIFDPGYQFGGSAPWCTGAAGAFLIDVSESTIVGNTIRNNDRPWNRLGGDMASRPLVFQASGAAAMSDLPHGGDQAIAFVLAKWPHATGYTATHNRIEGNVLQANCPAAQSCVGLGYFASRGTGFVGNDWSAATTNYYLGNNPMGSQFGSKRCGGNWYAADTECPDGSGPPCNVDDYQHDPPAGDWARNDFCSHY